MSNAKRQDRIQAVASAEERKIQELWIGELRRKTNVYRVEEQIAKSKQDVVSVKGVKGVKEHNGKIVIDGDEVVEEWRS